MDTLLPDVAAEVVQSLTVQLFVVSTMIDVQQLSKNTLVSSVHAVLHVLPTVRTAENEG